MNNETNAGSGKALAGFILGLLSIILWIIPLFGLPSTIVGLILSIKGKESNKKSLAMAGIVLNIIFLALTIGNFAIGAYMGATGQF